MLMAPSSIFFLDFAILAIAIGPTSHAARRKRSLQCTAVLYSTTYGYCYTAVKPKALKSLRISSAATEYRVLRSPLYSCVVRAR